MTAQHTPTHRWIPWIVTALLSAGLAVRLVGLGNGLPDVVGADEGFEIHRALKLGTGEMDFDRIGKGGFFYLLFVEYGAYFVWLRVAGAIGSAAEFGERFAVDATPFWMIARVTHVAVAILVVLWTFILGRRLYSAEAGLIGASVVAVSPLLVTHSRTVGVDMPMTLLVLMAIQLLWHWSQPERKCRPVSTGALVGAATMTKLPAGLLLLPLAVANWLRFRRESGRRALLNREVVAACLTAVVVFVVGTPGIVVHFGDVVRGIGHTLLGIGSPSAADADMGPGEGANLWRFYLRSLAGAMGIPLVLLSVVGVGVAVYRRRPADWVVLAFAIPFYVLIAGAQTSHLYYPRYVIPLIPLLGILAGRALWGAARAWSIPALSSGTVAATVSVLCLLPSLTATLEWCVIQTREDSRILTRRWFEANVPAGSRVFLVGNPISPSAPGLSLPLLNTDANVASLAAELRSTEPTKAEFLETRQRSVQGRRYDLYPVRHFDPVGTLEEYRSKGVRYFVLSAPHFDPVEVARDKKHAPDVLASRQALHEALNAAPDASLVFELDPEGDGRPGPGFAIYRLREPPPASSGSPGDSDSPGTSSRERRKS